MKLLFVFAVILACTNLSLSQAWGQASSANAKKSSHKKTAATTKAKTPTKRKPTAKTAAKPVAKNTTHKAAAYELINVRIYSNPGDIYQSTVPALLLSDKFAAIRLDSANTLEDLSVHSRIFAATSRWVQMYPVDVEMDSNWILLKSDDRLPTQSAKFATGQTAAQMARLFHYETEGQWQHETAAVRERAYEKRSISSVAASGHGLLERKLQSYGDHIAQVIQASKSSLKMDTLAIGPQIDGLPCQGTSPIVSSETLQASLAGAHAIGCEALSSFQLEQNFNFGFRMQAGTLQFRGAAAAGEDVRQQLLQNIAARETENLRKMSSQIKYSTPTTCEASHLTDKNVDVYYCTRGLRGFHSLSDSMVIVGKISGRNYVYNMTRASGFSAESTQNIVQANVNILEANP